MSNKNQFFTALCTGRKFVNAYCSCEQYYVKARLYAAEEKNR